MKTIGIISGAGMVAGELLRLIIQHPHLKLKYVQSNSQAGNQVTDIHADLFGDIDLHFSSEADPDVDIAFICKAHGQSRSYLHENSFDARTIVIDLGSDFRLNPNPFGFIYGLSEFNRDKLSGCQFIANPGCFATAIQLGLLPLARHKLLNDEVHINAVTGATGAGLKPLATTHFSWRTNNVSVYKAFDHQHLGEIQRTLSELDPGFSEELNFIPVRGNFTRGIFASMYLKSDLELEEAYALYETEYKNEKFVHVSRTNPYLKQVVNTNKCILHLIRKKNKLMIVSMIDNLMKGAAGQAIQNLNISLGLPEEEGLKMKAMAY